MSSLSVEYTVEIITNIATRDPILEKNEFDIDSLILSYFDLYIPLTSDKLKPRAEDIFAGCLSILSS